MNWEWGLGLGIWSRDLGLGLGLDNIKIIYLFLWTIMANSNTTTYNCFQMRNSYITFFKYLTMCHIHEMLFDCSYLHIPRTSFPYKGKHSNRMNLKGRSPCEF